MNRQNVLKLIGINALVVCVVFALAVAGDRTVTALNGDMLFQQRPCIIIDAGHGGVDGGATSCTGVLESAINLDIALRLNDFMHLLGMNTKMIRTTDISVYTKGETISAKKVSDLKNRVKIVNETENAVLISIHQNHFEDCRYSGAQVFYSNTENSIHFAQMVQSSFVETINQGSSRRVKKADGVYLLQNVNPPAILVECGFLSNQQEESLLRNPNYQIKICSVIASATSRYLAENTVS